MGGDGEITVCVRNLQAINLLGVSLVTPVLPKRILVQPFLESHSDHFSEDFTIWSLNRPLPPLRPVQGRFGV